jgi:hypothetical protein
MKYILIIASIMLASTVTAQTYSLRDEDHPGINPNFAEWIIPFNKTYDHLTQEQRKQIRSAYEHLAESDDPPYPLQGMKEIILPIHEVQNKLLENGTLCAIADVDQNGDVQKIAFYSTPSKEMTQAVSLILISTKFKPATCAGNPCSMQFPIKVSFEVQ